MKVLDTSVIVDHLRGFPPATSTLAAWLVAEEVLVASELTRFELLAGARVTTLADLDRFLVTLDWVPVTENVTRRAGDLARRYRGSHAGIDTVDYIVAATADLLHADLATTNLRHFPMFGGLRRPYPAAPGDGPGSGA